MKLSEENLLEFRIELEELITEREGMIALNSQRAIQGWFLAYDDVAFSQTQEKMRGLREKLIHLGEKGGW